METKNIIPLSDVRWVKIFSHSAGCCFIIMMVFFSLQKLLVKLSARAICVMFRKLCPMQIAKGYSRLSFILSSMYLILSQGLWSTCIWFLSGLIDFYPFVLAFKNVHWNISASLSLLLNIILTTFYLTRKIMRFLPDLSGLSTCCTPNT